MRTLVCTTMWRKGPGKELVLVNPPMDKQTNNMDIKLSVAARCKNWTKRGTCYGHGLPFGTCRCKI